MTIPQEIKCHQCLVVVDAVDDNGLQKVFFRGRHIDTVKPLVNGKCEIKVKSGKPHVGEFPLWLACGTILTSHLVHKHRPEDQARLPE